MTLTDPGVLGIGILSAAIAVAVGLVFWLARGKDWFGPRRRRILWTTSTAVAALLLALAVPSIGYFHPGSPEVIFVADASPSMRFGQPWPQAARWVRRELPAITALGVVSFSGSTQVIAPPAARSPEPATWDTATAPAGPATDIEQAIRTATTLARDPERTALLLYSDGYETSGHALLAAAEARQRGLRLYCLPPAKPPLPPNAAVVDLIVPEHLEPGRTGAVRAAVLSNRDGAATVRLTVAAGPHREPTEVARSVACRKDTTHWVEFPLELSDEGTAVARVSVSFPGDAVPEDDRWTFTVQVGGRRPVLVVHYEGEDRTARRVPPPIPPDWPTETAEATRWAPEAADLSRYAAVVLDDVPAHSLSSRATSALVQYVRDMGGGLVALGGTNSFGLGGYPRTALEDILPVRSDPEDRPPVRVAVVLDRSASMGRLVVGRQKLALAKEAVLRIAALLAEKDRVELVVFNHACAVAAADVAPSRWDRLRAALAPVRATGGTQIGPALEAALDALAATPAKTPDGKDVRRHVIALSDGIVIGDDGRAPLDVAAMADKARQLNASLSVVLTGRGDAWPGLRQLAEQTGGRFYDIADGLITATGRNRLETIFLEDLELPLLADTPTPVATGDGPPIWPPEAPPPAAFADVPQHLVTEAKRRAAVHLAAGPKSRPLLATWPCGLGRAVAWPVPWNEPNRAWLNRSEVVGAFAAALTWASRGPVAEADYDVALSAAGGRLRVRVDRRSLPEALAPMPELTLTLNSADAGQPLTYNLDRTGPGNWSLAQSIPAGSYGYSLTADHADRRQRVRQGTFSTGPSLEFRHLDNHSAFLERLAREGGGTVLDSPADVCALVVPDIGQIDLWPGLVALAGLVILYEAVRELTSRGR